MPDGAATPAASAEPVAVRVDPATGLPRETRYGTRRWKRLRLEILQRDGRRCWVPSCPEWATVADHIDPVTREMPDWLFYDPRNLRASCRRHNVVRGVVARYQRETAGLEEPKLGPGRWVPVTRSDKGYR
jgi:hypothetical protein